MKNSKSVLMGMLALALTVGLVLAGCKSPVEVDVGGVGKAKNVAAAATTNNRFYIVTWEAGADAGKVNYEVVVAEVVNKKQVETNVTWQGQNSEAYDAPTGGASANTDYSKWSVIIGDAYYNSFGTRGLKAGTYKVGVRTTDVLDNSNKTGTIAWAKETFTLVAEAAPAGTITATAGGHAAPSVDSATITLAWTQPANGGGHVYTATLDKIEFDGEDISSSANGTTFLSNAGSLFGGSGNSNTGALDASGQVYTVNSGLPAGVFRFHATFNDQDNNPLPDTSLNTYNVFEVSYDGVWSNFVTVVD